MRGLRRLSISLGVAVTVAATLTIVSVGAAGGFGLGAGTFTFNDTSATASFFNPADGSSVNLSVDRSLFVVRPRPSGALQTQAMTLLSLNQFIPNPIDPTLPPTTASTCLVIPDADFTVSSDLQSASLNAPDQSTLCPGFLVPVNGAVIKGGGPGGGGSTGFTLPISVTATWTGNGAVGVSVSNGTFRCLTFVSITHDHNQQALSSNVTASISGLGAFSGSQSSGVFGAVSLNSSVQNVAGRGILPPECGGKGG